MTTSVEPKFLYSFDNNRLVLCLPPESYTLDDIRILVDVYDCTVSMCGSRNIDVVSDTKILDKIKKEFPTYTDKPDYFL